MKRRRDSSQPARTYLVARQGSQLAKRLSHLVRRRSCGVHWSLVSYSGDTDKEGFKKGMQDDPRWKESKGSEIRKTRRRLSTSAGAAAAAAVDSSGADGTETAPPVDPRDSSTAAASDESPSSTLLL